VNGEPSADQQDADRASVLEEIVQERQRASEMRDPFSLSVDFIDTLIVSLRVDLGRV
jgi:hypothetical protein